MRRSRRRTAGPLCMFVLTSSSTTIITHAFLHSHAALRPTQHYPHERQSARIERPAHLRQGLLFATDDPSSAEAEGDGGVWRDGGQQQQADVLRLYIDCYHDGKELMDPWVLSEALLGTGAYSSTLQDASKGTSEETPIFGEPGIEVCRTWANTTVMADYPPELAEGDGVQQIVEAVRDAFGIQAPGLPRYRLEMVGGRDWVREVQEGWKPLPIGKSLLIKFTWHTHHDVRPYLDENPYLRVMTLEGGAAFGTGEHPTTAMCTEWIEKQLQDRHDASAAGPTVIDYGSGSGILALWALMMGARRAIGVEIDTMAIVSAHRNAELNGLKLSQYVPRVYGEDGGEGAPSGFGYRSVSVDGHVSASDTELQPCDVMVANILAKPLITLAPELSRLTNTGGKIALAGLLEEQAPGVLSAYRQAGFEMSVSNNRDGWALLTGVKVA